MSEILEKLHLKNKETTESHTIQHYVGDLNSSDLARCKREDLLEALEIQERNKKQAEKDREKQNKMYAPYFNHRNQIQQKKDAVREKLLEPTLTASQKLDSEGEFNQLVREGDALETEISNLEEKQRK